MIIVDTSIWVEHLKKGNRRLSALLEDGQVYVHPYVLGELALGNLRNRSTDQTLMKTLPQPIIADHDEVLDYILRHGIAGTGIGYVDAHLLVAATLTGTLLWTYDKALHKIAAKLGLAA